MASEYKNNTRCETDSAFDTCETNDDPDCYDHCVTDDESEHCKTDHDRDDCSRTDSKAADPSPPNVRNKTPKHSKPPDMNVECRKIGEEKFKYTTKKTKKTDRSIIFIDDGTYNFVSDAVDSLRIIILRDEPSRYVQESMEEIAPCTNLTITWYENKTSGKFSGSCIGVPGAFCGSLQTGKTSPRCCAIELVKNGTVVVTKTAF
jgi:hypothetical protein